MRLTEAFPIRTGQGRTVRMEVPIVEPIPVLEPAVVVEPTEEAKAQLASKNGKKPEGAGGSSFFTWFMVLALLGVWTSVAVVYFDLVDYQGVIGKLSSYDADGDGDFDVEDAKVLLGLTKDGSQESSDSLEEVLDMLAEEGSDWFQGFFTFLYGLINPFEDEEEAAEEESAGTSQTDGVQGKSCVILGLHNQ